MGQLQSVVQNLDNLEITSSNGDREASGCMQEIQIILVQYFRTVTQEEPGQQETAIPEDQSNRLEKYNLAKALKDNLYSIVRDVSRVILKNSSDYEDQLLYLIAFLLWTFALRPGSKSSSVVKGPLTLQWRHLILDTRRRVVTLCFPTKGFGIQGLSLQEHKFSISVSLESQVFERIRTSKGRHKRSDCLFYINYDYFFKYLKEKHGDFLPKQFRTVAASYASQELLEGTLPDSSNKQKITFLMQCAEKVQKYLQHTKVQEIIKSYLDPRIILAWCVRHRINVRELPEFMRAIILSELNPAAEFQFQF